MRWAGAGEERILDAAGELLLIFGYRRVTIDDVARRAEVGKGTVYLHWSSKLELFAAVLLREVAAIVAEQLAAMRADPAEIRLHRTMRTLFLLVMRRPLARAFYTGDTELLGALITDTKIGLRFAAQKSAMGAALPGRAARARPAAPTTRPPIRVARTGSPARRRASSCSNGCCRPASISTSRRKADGLAELVRRGFEPAAEPDPAAAGRGRAPPCIELYEHMLVELTSSLPEESQ